MSALPETLESFTFTYKKRDVLEDKLTFVDFIRGLIQLGVVDLSFDIYFSNDDDDPNLEAIRNIFSHHLSYLRVKHIKFHDCPNVWKLENLFENLESVETISFTQCNIGRKFLILLPAVVFFICFAHHILRVLLNICIASNIQNLLHMLRFFKEPRNLSLLNLNYNQIDNATRDEFKKAIKSNQIKLRQANLYNNKLKPTEEERFGTMNFINFSNLVE